MRRPVLVLTALVATAIAAVAACAPPAMNEARGGGGATKGNPPSTAASAGSASAGPGGPVDAGSSGGGGTSTFRLLCGSSHVLPDDPIVHPNMAGMSHLHQFFGNRTTNAGSTEASLLGQPTTCSSAADASAYWGPLLYQNGVAVPAASALIYYRGGTHRDPSAIQPFPPGLRMIAGDAQAASPLPTAAVAWMCMGMEIGSTTPPDCGGQTLVLQLRFPDCWDGVNLDSPDHKSHMAYTVGGLCPSNYPVPVPLLEFNLRYKTAGGAGVGLASGAPWTYHADFFNGWNQTAQANFVALCLNRGLVCGTVS
jgi:hypothetical protein